MALGHRGQEAAPFELLVAVIIMGFVIFVGLQAMQMSIKVKCYNETDAKLEEMKTTLESVVGKGEPQQIDFMLSECYNPRDETIRVKDYSEPELCAEYCGIARRLCTLLQYYYEGEGGFSIRKCLDINPDTSFPGEPGSACPDKSSEGFELVAFDSEGIIQGSYRLVNKTSATSTFPTICAYRKVS